MNNFLRHLIICISPAIALSSCDDPLTSADSANRVSVKVSIEIPPLAEGAEVVDRLLTFHNISSGKSYIFVADTDIELLPGLYDVAFTARVFTPGAATTTLRANAQSLNITGAETPVHLTAYNRVETDDLIIAEVFFAGTLHPSGNQYNGDDYIKLYNNTDHVIYADGITLFESKFLTTRKYDYQPDIMQQAMTVQALYTIPGSGTDVPVAPGQYLLIADTGIDHRVANPNSFDLSHADFEWYDMSSVPKDLDIDGPPANLDKWYCYTRSYWVLHNRGLKAFGIARIPIARDEYLKEYFYTYEYDEVTIAGTFPMSQSAYRLPNDWIIDVVTCSIDSDYAWQLCSPTLDCGWTGCGTIDRDKTRFFHSVRRKLLYVTDDGRAVLADTNNSTDDFNRMCVASEIEMQHTALDAAGNTSQVITYDGVVPCK